VVKFWSLKLQLISSYLLIAEKSAHWLFWSILVLLGSLGFLLSLHLLSSGNNYRNKAESKFKKKEFRKK